MKCRFMIMIFTFDSATEQCISIALENSMEITRKLLCIWSLQYFIAVILRQHWNNIYQFTKLSERKFVLLAIEVNKSVGERCGSARRKKLSTMHNAIKKLHSTQFVFLHSQLVNQKLLFSTTPPLFQNEMFIKLLFIAIDAFNGENTKSFYDFCNSIFYNSRIGMLFYNNIPLLALLVCHSREMFSERAKNIKRIKYLHAPYNLKLKRWKNGSFVDFWRLNIWNFVKFPSSVFIIDRAWKRFPSKFNSDKLHESIISTLSQFANGFKRLLLLVCDFYQNCFKRDLLNAKEKFPVIKINLWQLT